MKEEAKLADEILGSQLVLKIPATTLVSRRPRLIGKYTVAITSLYTVAQALAANASGRATRSIITTAPNVCCRMVPTWLRDWFMLWPAQTTLVVAASLKSPMNWWNRAWPAYRSSQPTQRAVGAAEQRPFRTPLWMSSTKQASFIG